MPANPGVAIMGNDQAQDNAAKMAADNYGVPATSGAATSTGPVITGATTGTVAPGAGGAGALPATPAGYLTVNINGTNRQIPYY